MAELDVKISSPASAMVEAAANMVTAIINASVRNRETMSQAARDEQDRIIAQMYWDWRGLLVALHIVPPLGEPKP